MGVAVGDGVRLPSGLVVAGEAVRVAVAAPVGGEPVAVGVKATPLVGVRVRVGLAVGEPTGPGVCIDPPVASQKPGAHVQRRGGGDT